MKRQDLSIEQEYALQQYEDGKNILLTGPGGTGKSCLIRKMVEISALKKEKIQVCAMTGCAAILLGCSATTIHSWSGIKMGRGMFCEIITNIKNNAKIASKWRSIHTLVLDEVSMLSKRLFELLDAIGKAVRGNANLPFGGIQVVFTGDFYQLPPIGGTEDGSGQFCFESDLWYNTFPLENHIELTTLFRQKDSQYKKILNNIREGIIDPDDMNILKTRMNLAYNKDDHNGVVPTKLYATKSKVDQINKEEFDKLTSICYEYDCIQKTDCISNLESGKPFSAQYLASMKKELTVSKKEMELRFLQENCPCDTKLYLKVGANVMCTVNLDIESGICNGSVGIIIGFSTGTTPPIPIVKFINGVTRQMSLKYWQSEEFPTIAIGQIPLRLAWAMTIHKSQGATLSIGEVDIGSSVFACGQTYVALSRIESLYGLYLSDLNPSKIKVNSKVKEFYHKIPKIDFEEEEEEDLEEEEEKEDQEKVEEQKEPDFSTYKYVTL